MNLNIEKDEQWINEKFQRNCISRGIDKLNLTDKDIIIIIVNIFFSWYFGKPVFGFLTGCQSFIPHSCLIFLK